jgi:hypothetical protein
MIKKIVPGKIQLQDLKPRVEDSKILFPLSVSSEFIQEDGFSFGYPVDSGWTTTIEYDFTVGILTEDAISLIKSLKKPNPPARGIYPIETYDFSDDQLNEWKIGLDTSWAEERYQEWLKGGLQSEGETKEQFIENELDCFHSWPTEWKLAYEATKEKLNTPYGKTQKVVVNGPLTLYTDDNGEFFFKTQHHDHGVMTKADKAAAIEYIEEFRVYQVFLDNYNEKANHLAEIIEQLKSTLT